MGSWNSIELQIRQLNRPDAYDIVRRQKIQAVQSLTGRHLVLYVADFATPNPIKAQLVGQNLSVTLSDKDGFDEVTRNLSQDKGLDVLLYSPGGSAEATESIIELLRARFSDIRFIIPSAAKSAATMMALSGNQLLMDECSELGPTDPQMVFIREGQFLHAPAQAIKDQFEKAQKEVNEDPDKLPSWVPILSGYGPSLLAQCDNHLALAQQLVTKWLSQYMFAGEDEGAEKAQTIAQYLAGHNNFLSHSRRVGINELQDLGVKVLDLRTTPELHTAIRDLHISIMLTFLNTGAYKIFENGQGEVLVAAMQVNVQQPAQSLQPALVGSQSSVERVAPLAHDTNRRQVHFKKKQKKRSKRR